MSTPSNIVSMQDPQIPINQGIFEEDSTQRAPLGTRLRVGERTFYYAQAGAALLAGQVACVPRFAASDQSGLCACASATTGATTITITAGTAYAANALVDFFISPAVSASAGAGLLLKIKSHGAITSAGTGALTLYDAVPSLIAGQAVSLTPSPFDGVIIGSQALDAAVGVAPIAVTASNYFWLQTWGPTNVKHAASTPANAVLHLGTIGGVVCTFDATTQGGIAGVAKQIGYNLFMAATATQYNPVMITILP